MYRKIYEDVPCRSDERTADRQAASLQFKSRIFSIFIGAAITVIMLSVSAAAAPLQTDSNFQHNEQPPAPNSTPALTQASDEAVARVTAEAAAASAKAQSMLSGVSQTKPSALPASTNALTPASVTGLQRGDENELVQLLQERLMELNFLDIDESTQLYSPATEYAVSLFQRQHMLMQNGIADSTTFDLIFSDSAEKYTLIKGTAGSDVDNLQRQLIDLGYLEAATGYFGTETIEAVKAFQERNGLFPDGNTGEITLGLIYSPEALVSAAKEQEEIKQANIQAFLEVAEQQLGDPYVFGNVGPNSFDCSGLVYYCLKQSGSSRSRYNAAGYAKVDDWEKITSMDDLLPGDLLFFSTGGKSVGHTGIYIGNGEMIDASTSNGRVVQRSCFTSFWTNNFVSARRPF